MRAPGFSKSESGRQVAKLTKRTVDAAKAYNADFFLWDDGLQRFGLHVWPSRR